MSRLNCWHFIRVLASGEDILHRPNALRRASVACQVFQSLTPLIQITPAKAIPIGNHAIAVDGDLGRLLQYVKVPKPGATNPGHGPGVTLLLAVLFQNGDGLGRV